MSVAMMTRPREFTGWVGAELVGTASQPSDGRRTVTPSAASAQQHGGLERRACGLGALVLGRAGQSRTVESLLRVLEREDAEPDGLAGIEGDPGQPVGRRVRHELEV